MGLCAVWGPNQISRCSYENQDEKIVLPVIILITHL